MPTRSSLLLENRPTCFAIDRLVSHQRQTQRAKIRLAHISRIVGQDLRDRLDRQRRRAPEMQSINAESLHSRIVVLPPDQSLEHLLTVNINEQIH